MVDAFIPFSKGCYITLLGRYFVNSKGFEGIRLLLCLNHRVGSNSDFAFQGSFHVNVRDKKSPTVIQFPVESMSTFGTHNNLHFSWFLCLLLTFSPTTRWRNINDNENKRHPFPTPYLNMRRQEIKSSIFWVIEWNLQECYDFMLTHDDEGTFLKIGSLVGYMRRGKLQVDLESSLQSKGIKFHPLRRISCIKDHSISFRPNHIVSLHLFRW